MQTLTNGQKQALLESQNGHNIFISGGGGVGKSYISQIIQCVVKPLASAMGI